MASNFIPDEEVDWEMKLEVLTELRTVLCSNLRYAWEKIVNYLRAKKVFDIEDYEEIKAEKTATRSTGKLLDILSTKGATGFEEFCNALNNACKGHEHILQKILDTLHEKRRDQVPIPKEPVPLSVEGFPSNTDEWKPTPLVTGVSRLPAPGEHGAPVPPDVITGGPECDSTQGEPTSVSPITPLPSYPSELPPPYSE